ncbi:hypothetical protein [Marinobacterium sp. BA1]|uniref:hypothetical protein n=1 Tax=Marinobacterium sp. BA1 TaxID=3138931 RepID=UPI0032E7E650
MSRVFSLTHAFFDSPDLADQAWFELWISAPDENAVQAFANALPRPAQIKDITAEAESDEQMREYIDMTLNASGIPTECSTAAMANWASGRVLSRMTSDHLELLVNAFDYLDHDAGDDWVISRDYASLYEEGMQLYNAPLERVEDPDVYIQYAARNAFDMEVIGAHRQLMVMINQDKDGDLFLCHEAESELNRAREMVGHHDDPLASNPGSSAAPALA